MFFLPSHKGDQFFEGNTILLLKSPYPDIPTFYHFDAYLTSCDHLFSFSSPLWLTSDGSVPMQSFLMQRLHHFFGNNVGGQSVHAGGATNLTLRYFPIFNSTCWAVDFRVFLYLHSQTSHSYPGTSSLFFITFTFFLKKKNVLVLFFVVFIILISSSIFCVLLYLLYTSPPPSFFYVPYFPPFFLFSSPPHIIPHLLTSSLINRVIALTLVSKTLGNELGAHVWLCQHVAPLPTLPYLF